MSTVISEQIVETRTTMMHEDGFEWEIRKETLRSGAVIVCAYTNTNVPLGRNDTFVRDGKIYRLVNEDLVCEGNDTSDEEMYDKLSLLCQGLKRVGTRLMLFEPDKGTTPLPLDARNSSMWRRDWKSSMSTAISRAESTRTCP